MAVIAGVLVLPLLAPAALTAATYVAMADATLADQADLIVVGHIDEVRPPRSGSAPVTRYRMVVEQVVKGSLEASILEVEVPGGRLADGSGLKIWGAPEFRENDPVLLFLARRPDGSYRILHLMLGAFYKVDLPGQSLALRNLKEARELVSRAGGEVLRQLGTDRPRDFWRFVAWLEDRELGLHREPDYYLEVPLADLEGRAERFTFLGNTPQRWFVFDRGDSVGWRAHERGQDGLPGGGFREVEVALAAWNADPDTHVRLTYLGTTDGAFAGPSPRPSPNPCTAGGCGFTRRDGVNAILFNDPNQEITGTYVCGGGGLLGAAGAWLSSQIGTYNGRSYWTIVEADVMINEGAECFLAGFDNRNAEEVFAHEMGHALGLGHSSENHREVDPVLQDALMYFVAHGDGRGARFNSDDRAGLRCLYGDSSTCDGSSGGSTTPPAAPSNLLAFPLSSSSVHLAWTDNSADEEEFRIEMRVATSDGFEETAPAPAGATSARVGALQAATTYTFRLRACNPAGCSAYSNEASATTFREPPTSPPSPPSAPVAESIWSSAIHLTWAHDAPQEAEFEVEMRTASINFLRVAVVRAGLTTITVRSLQSTTTYIFRLRACNPAGCSAYSPQVGITTLEAGHDPPPAPPGSGLSSAEAACDEGRLRGLLERLSVQAPNTDKLRAVNLSLTATGDFVGIAYTGNGPFTPEHHLAFSSNPEETSLLRNPGRPQLPSVSLSRNSLNSDLVGPGSPDELRLVVNPTLDLAGSDPRMLLVVDNVAGSAGSPTSTRPGRGLAGLLAPCHRKFTARDVHVFRVLSKVARAQAAGGIQYKLAIYRGEAEDTYRVDVYPVTPAGAPLGRLAVEIAVSYHDVTGELLGGRMRILSRCSGENEIGCTRVTGFAQLQLVQPVPPGERWFPSVYRVFTLGPEGGGVAETFLNWLELLAGTTWGRGVGD